MLRKGILWVALLLSLLFCVEALPIGSAAARPARARCRQLCGQPTIRCALKSPYRYRKALRLCRASLIRQCRTFGEIACEFVPTTTTTTSSTSTTAPVVNTTSTSTTQPRPTTTTSTVPVYPNYAGHWTFTGTLASDTCGSSSVLVDGFSITQVAASMTSTVDSVPGVTLFGGLTSDGFSLDGSFIQGGCTVEIALVVQASGQVIVSAGTGFDVSCGFSSCRSIWVGTLTR